MQCEACKAEVHPVQEMLPNGAGFTNRCPRLECGAPMAPIPVRNVVGDVVQEAMVALEYQPNLSPAHEAAQVIATSRGARTVSQPIPDEERLRVDGDLVAVARTRLATIDLQLASVDKLQAEARRLRAMIAAVEALDAN